MTRGVEAIRKLCAGKHPDIEPKAIEKGWDETRVAGKRGRCLRDEGEGEISRVRKRAPGCEPNDHGCGRAP